MLKPVLLLVFFVTTLTINLLQMHLKEKAKTPESLVLRSFLDQRRNGGSFSMNKVRIVWISVALAFLLVFMARNLSNQNPFSMVQFPGWAVAFGLFFAAEDDLTTTILFESFYWIINVALWFL